VVDEITPTRVIARLAVDERHLQPYGIVHGGVYAAVAEAIASIGAAVSASSRDPEAGVVGLDNHTSFLRAAGAGTEIVAEAQPRHAGRRTQSWAVIMRDGSGRELATSTVRLLVQPLRDLPGGSGGSGPTR
jgi:1,4-dihydroxy-2-naphthoyl-CoA hydrolase